MQESSDGKLSLFSELVILQASSSIGRASDSKSESWGFESLLACQILA